MAQTKAKSPSGARSTSKQRIKPSKPKARKAKPSKPKARKPRSRKPSTVPDKAKAVGETIESGAKEAGGNVARAVSKAKVPLLAGGAALAGVAGGAAIGAHQARRHRGIVGVSSDDVGRAARKMGDFGAQMGEVAIELRRARQASNGKQHRSPVEVVLEGLTSRR
jgi:hypothetical protein